MAQNILNRYEGMQFPEYKYREFPKHLTVKVDGRVRTVTVKNEHQERKVLSGSDDQIKKVVSDNKDEYQANQEKIVGHADKDSLLKRANDLGITVDKRWSAETLKREVDKGELALANEKEAEEEELKREMAADKK